MGYIREETIENFTDEELLQMLKECLGELGIAYEEKPGGLWDGPALNPSIFVGN